MDVLVLSRTEVEALLDPRALMAALADGFRALSAGAVQAPSRNALARPGEAFLLSMPGHRDGGPMAVKVVTVFEANARRGLATHLATIGLYDADTGACLAFMDGTYITAIRTSAAAALACDLLARPAARVLAIVGAGVQAEHHLATFSLVRDLEEIRVAAQRSEDAERIAALDPRARAVASAREAAEGADVVALTTHAGRPVVEPGWIAPGAHVSSIGYRPPAGELPVELARAGRLVVETRLAFAPPPDGCGELQGLDPAAAAELGEILAGAAPGRRTAEEITVYKAMGHVVEDLVAARLVYDRARADGAGRVVAL
jgi:alanine dehydrogenase